MSKTIRKKKWERSSRPRCAKTPMRIERRRKKPVLTAEEYTTRVELTRKAAIYLTIPHEREEREARKSIGTHAALRLAPLLAALMGGMGGARRRR